MTEIPREAARLAAFARGPVPFKAPELVTARKRRDEALRAARLARADALEEETRRHQARKDAIWEVYDRSVTDAHAGYDRSEHAADLARASSCSPPA